MIKLMRGDCLELMANIPDGSIDLVLCDLPYGTTRNRWDSVLPLDVLWSQYWRICRVAVVLTAQTPFDKVLGVSSLAELRYEWVWEKTAATGFMNAKKAPLKAHENILVFYKKPPTYNPQMMEGAPLKQVGAGLANHGNNYGVAVSARAPYSSTQRYPRSVLRYAKDNKLTAAHPTQKPVALMEYLIRTYTNEGDTVLDNCMGSGTTGVACVNAGRSFIGIELDREYFRVARRRIKEAKK